MALCVPYNSVPLQVQHAGGPAGPWSDSLPALLAQVPPPQAQRMHFRPPNLQVRRGLWSSPLMSVGPKLYTLYDGPQTLSGKEGREGRTSRVAV